MLDWSQKKLADECGVSAPTIKLVETGKTDSTPETLAKIQKAFEQAGLEFLPQNGVRSRDDLLTIIEKRDERDDIYLRLLDDMYHSTRGTNAEILHSFIDNSLSPPEVIARERMLRATGISLRHLVRYGDTFLLYPLDEYRYLPKGYYINNPTSVYADKVAFVVQDRHKSQVDKIIIIRDQDIANVKRKEFEIIWNYAEKASVTTATETYG